MRGKMRYAFVALAGACFAVLPDRIAAQAATLVGVVMADSSERPLANVEVTLPRLDRRARTDSAGNFRFTGLKAGVHEVVIRMVGYEPISTTLRLESGKTIEGDFLLRKLSTQLAAVEVKDKFTLHNFRLSQFNENKVNGGRYLNADLFEQSAGRSLGSILMTKIGGVRIIRQASTEGVLASLRGAGMTLGPCPMRVVMNGLGGIL